MPKALHDFEAIINRLKANGWNVDRTAEELEMDRASLCRRLKRNKVSYPLIRMRGKRPMAYMAITLQPALLKRLDAYCEANNGNRSAVVREAIEAYIKGGKKNGDPQA